MIKRLDHTLFTEAQLKALRLPRLYMAARRAAEVLLLLLASPLWVPFFAFLYLVQAARMKGGVIFVQDRPGLGGEYFRCYKFRTMSVKKDYDGIYSHEPERIDSFNNFLRKHRLDEIPQLFNILKGDMALIGPRPEAHFYYEECLRNIRLYNYRFLVKPGLTGWAQVFHKHTDSMSEAADKFDYDLYYLHHINLKHDCLILFLTFKVLITGSGAK